jgi:thiamine-phosphate pyrophosphorylase
MVMRPRQPLPRLWLMTDERLGSLSAAIGRLPQGSGIVFRHYGLEPAGRRRLFDLVRRLADAGDHLLLLAGPAEQALAWGADGSHGRGPGARGEMRSAPVHDYRELRAAERARADFVFLSPVYATQSHRDVRPLGLARFAWLARRSALPVIALGGMNADRGRRLASFGAYGWAGIDAWSDDEVVEPNVS